MTDEAPDPVVQLLDKAIHRVASKDDSLRGSTATRWVVVAEHAWPEGGSTFSIFHSDPLSPWDTLGMLNFATAIETTKATGRYRDDD
jgi:hypothetical protein